MYDLTSILFGTVALGLVTYVALWVVKQSTARAELTDASRQRMAGCGFALLALAVVGCIAAFVIAAGRLVNSRPEPAPVIHIDSKRL